MRKKLLTLLSMVMVLALSLALCVSNVFAAETASVDYGTDASKWMWPYNVTVTEDGLKTTGNTYCAASNSIYASAKIKVVEKSNVPDGQWGRHAIMFKVNDDNVFLWNPSQTTSASNWLAVAICHDTSTLAIYECVDGVVSVVAESAAVSGFDNWYAFKQTNTWEIEYKDVADGVVVSASFTATDGIGHTTTGNTYTVSYKSTNTALHGAGKMAINRQGGGTYTEENHSLINVFVEEIKNEPAGSDNDIATGIENWEALTGVSISGGVMKSSSNNFRAVSNAFGGNSTFTVTLDASHNAFDNGGWGYDWVLFKADGSFVDANDLTTASGNWIGLIYGASYGKVDIIECVDGVVTKKDMSGTISGYDNWYSRVQKTNIVITTTDTETGVDVAIHFEATDSQHPEHADKLRVGGYDFTYSSTNTKLWGEQKLVIGSLCSINPTAETGYYISVKVDDVDSDYVYEAPQESEDERAARLVSEAIDKLPAVVDRVNYSAELVAAVDAAKDAYAALTDAQKALVTNKDALDTAVAALAAYEATLVEPDFDETNLAQNASAWSRYGNVNSSDVVINNYGLSFIGSYNSHKAMLLKSNVKADSTIALRFDAQTNTSWGQSYVMFKNMESADTVNAGAPLFAVEHGGVAGVPSGTWMALMFGNSSGLYFMVCVDGELTTYSIPSTVIPSSEYDLSHKQITDITIATVDTETGVEVTITYKASGVAGVTGETYTLTYNVENTAFHGDYAFAVSTYNGSIVDTENVILTDLRVTNANGEALVNRGTGSDVNFATDLKYFRDGANVAGFSFDEDGAKLWDTKTGGLILNHLVKNEDVVKVSLDGTLPRHSGSYGNVYFIIRSKEGKAIFNGSHFPTAQGNYIVLAVGADGIKIFECIDGEMQHGAKLLSNGAIEGGYDLSQGTNGNDIWYIYNSYTRFEFYTEDYEGGVDVLITMKAPSGKTYYFEYNSENTNLHGDHYFGLEYFFADPGSSTGIMTIESLSIEGVTEGFVPNVDVNELNAQMIATAETAITAENVEAIVDKYLEYVAIVNTLNYTMAKQVSVNALSAIAANLENYAKDVAAAAAFVAKVDEFYAQMDTATINAITSWYANAKVEYNALSDAAKAMVTNKDKLDAVAARVESYEIDRDAAAAFDALVSAIADVTAENRDEVEAAIVAAETAYAVLTDAQKEMTTAHGDLVAKRNALTAFDDAQKPSKAGCAGGFGASAIFGLAALVAIKRLKKRA